MHFMRDPFAEMNSSHFAGFGFITIEGTEDEVFVHQVEYITIIGV